MQCQSQLKQSGLLNALGTKAQIQSKNRAWFANKHPFESDEECMEAFPDIENMTINRFHKSYMESKGHPDFRFVNLGLWTVDIKERIKFLTDDPENKEMHRIVIQGQSHVRQRP